MYLYQNEISIIKYLNYDDTTKTKDASGVPKNTIQSILELLCFENYLESQACERTPAYKTFRSETLRKEIYIRNLNWNKTTAS